MSIIKITSKRQATLPKELCDEMGVKPGDSLRVERLALENHSAWIIQPLESSQTPGWIGSLKRYASGKSHDMETIRKSISEARSRGQI